MSTCEHAQPHPEQAWLLPPRRGMLTWLLWHSGRSVISSFFWKNHARPWASQRLGPWVLEWPQRRLDLSPDPTLITHAEKDIGRT